MLRTAGLKKHFGYVRAVDGVDIELKKGEIVSLIGPNGAGKTTLVNLITGLLRPDAGKVFCEGEDVTDLPSYERAKRGIARSFQIITLYEGLTVLDNVRVAIFSRLGKTKKMFSLADNDLQVKEETLEILETFGLRGRECALPRELSHGDRKLLDVAIAFSLKPKVILLDEPTSGVSRREKMAVMDTMISVMRSKGITTMIVEHDMDVVSQYSDRTLVMHEGKIIAEGTPIEISKNREIRHILFGER